MSIIVRPISANLTHDTELFSRMVLLILSRIPSSKFTSGADSIGLRFAKTEVNIHRGMKHLP